MHSLSAVYVCLKPIVKRLVPGGSFRPGRRFSNTNQGIAQSNHTPPEKAIRTLKAFVLFSVLSSDLRPLRIPTMIAKITISPAEQIAKDVFDMRLRESEVNFV